MSFRVALAARQWDIGQRPLPHTPGLINAQSKVAQQRRFGSIRHGEFDADFGIPDVTRQLFTV